MKRKTSNKLSNDSIVTNASSEEDSERRKLLFSLENAFSISYVTLISIIQGGAFGYWVDVLDRMTDQGRNLTNINFESWLLILLAFILIVTVWNEYMMGATIFNWIPSLMDALIPFIIGVTEILVILSIEHSIRWGIISMGMFYFTAFVGFENMYRRADKAGGNYYKLKHIHFYRYFTSSASALMSILLLSIGIFILPKVDNNSNLHLYTLLFTMISVILMLIRAIMYWNHIVKFARGN
jgi:hypothetical protein